MPPRSVQCMCNRRFNTDDAMRQHQRDSPRHVTPRTTEHVPPLEELVQRLSLQDQDANVGFIPFVGGEPTTRLTSNPDIRISTQVMTGAKKLFVAEGSRPKTKKTRKGTALKSDRGSFLSSKLNPLTGQMMNLLEDEDWALCDKDCGWCGHCAEGASF